MKRIIGVCMTRVQDELNRNYIEALQKWAEPLGYSIVVFHSIFNFYYEYSMEETEEKELYRLDGEMGTRMVFDMLPYDDLVALVMTCDSIYDKNVVSRIIDGANKHKVPVIMARGVDERCISLYGDYSINYRDMLVDIIRKYNLKEVMYIGGIAGGNVDTDTRIDIFRKALEITGIPYDDSMVEYGEYWELPTYEIIDRRLKDGAKPPEAIFCANDSMAIAVIKRLAKYGYSVPGDVLVTGFDGIEVAYYNDPPITTCCEDKDDLAMKTLDIINWVISGVTVKKEYTYSFRCENLGSADRSYDKAHNSIMTRIFDKYRESEIDEDNNNFWLDSVIKSPSIDALEKSIEGIISEGRAIAFRQDAFIQDGEFVMDEGALDAAPASKLPERMYMISKKVDGTVTKMVVPLEQVIPNMVRSVAKGRIGFVSTIAVRDIVYGFVMDSITDPVIESVKVNRLTRTLDRALMVSAGGEKQLQLANQISEARYTDAVTGLMNMDGLNKWYSSYIEDKSVHSTAMAVGVYTFITYQKVYDENGTDILEDSLQYIARSLSLANPENSVVARISVDSFAVLVSFGTDEVASSIIDKSVSLFYGFLDVKNQTSDYLVEVSCGYTDLIPPWEGKLGYFISAATSNLYKNRMNFETKLPDNIDVHDSVKLNEFKSMFMMIVEENLLTYHFQPIVDARTGRIFAYEALMRAPAKMKMSPLDILSAAELFRKLNYIEHATFFSIFERVEQAGSIFDDKSVFINTIPGSFLTDQEIKELNERFGSLIEKAVVEITESETVTSRELHSIRKMAGEDKSIRIAIDDYGIGHSNIVNLIEYKPQVVKVDRYLITDIDKNANKQMFLKSIIDFSAVNNIKVLAEGVETREELKTVIEFGVDYIQGYYTARPQLEIMEKIPDEIAQEIIEFNKERDNVWN